jgi:hypothetical protein
MPAKKKTTAKTLPKKDMILRNQFFGMLLIALAVGALIVFVRYLIITMVSPADVYVIQPGQLIPGMGN